LFQAKLSRSETRRLAQNFGGFQQSKPHLNHFSNIPQ